MPDLGVYDRQATDPAGWKTSTYKYEGVQPHAVTSVALEGGSTSTYEYDANGNPSTRPNGQSGQA